MKKFVYRFKMSFLATFLVALSMVGRGQEMPQILLIQPTAPDIVWLLPPSAGLPATRSYLISWTDNFINNVRVILIKYDGGGNELRRMDLVPADQAGPPYIGVPGSTYKWTIDQTFRNSPLWGPGLYKILVRSILNTTLADQTTSLSENYFELVTSIGGEIKVLQPDIADIKIPKNSPSYWISWTDNLSEPVDIILVSGTHSPTTIATGVIGSTYVWPVSTWVGTHTSTVTVGDNYKVRVTCNGCIGDIYDESDNDFQFVETLGGNITFIQPYGGEIWRVGSEHLISWTDNLSEPVRLTLRKVSDNSQVGGSYETIGQYESTKKWTMTETGSFYFRIESTILPGTYVTNSASFQVVDNLGSDITLIQPYGGEIWAQNTTHLISWTDNLTENVDIVLTDEFGTPIGTIFFNVVGSTKSWPVGLLAPGDYKIRVEGTTHHGTFGICENPFTIVNSLGGEITMIQPNVSGIQWALGSTHLISWTDNFPPNERIAIDLVNGGTFTQTLTVPVTGVPGYNPTTFSWYINPAIPAGSYKIRVYRINPILPLLEAYSENSFTLYEPLDKLVVYPNPCNESTAVQFADEGEASYTVNLYDRFGALVLQKSVNTSDTKELNIPTSQLPNGIYFLNTTSNDSQTVNSKKIVIQH